VPRECINEGRGCILASLVEALLEHFFLPEPPYLAMKAQIGTCWSCSYSHPKGTNGLIGLVTHLDLFILFGSLLGTKRGLKR
jgi:hypothetical protein